MLMFVRMNCRCVGIQIQEKFICIIPCDKEIDDPDLFFFARKDDMRGVKEPLSEEETDSLIDRIHKTLMDGDRYRQIRWLLQL